MNDRIRQIAVIITTVAVLIVNGLANALPINGHYTGEISDRFDVYFIPAGYVFSIWGLIFLGLAVYTVFQALPSQRENPRLRATGWWVVLGSLANAAWIFLWHYELFSLTIIAMLALLATLILTYLGLGVGRASVSQAETWAARVPFSIYLGWITVATIANVTALLDYWGWDGAGIAPEIWTSIMLVAVLVITALVIFTRRDIAYALVILWSLAGIAIKHAQVPAVAIPAWTVFALVILTLLATFVLQQRRLYSTPQAR